MAVASALGQELVGCAPWTAHDLHGQGDTPRPSTVAPVATAKCGSKPPNLCTRSIPHSESSPTPAYRAPPPQLGGCAMHPEGMPVAAALDGSDGASWRLPLPPLSATSLPEPYSPGDNPPMDRLEAAAKMVRTARAPVPPHPVRHHLPRLLRTTCWPFALPDPVLRLRLLRRGCRSLPCTFSSTQIRNHEAVVRFALRGPGQPGPRPVSAPLSDPTAVPATQHTAEADAALRHVVHALLVGVDAKQVSQQALQVGGLRTQGC